MSNLYTALMKKIMPLLTENWQIFLMLVGVLFLLGAIFRWKWVCDPQGENIIGINFSIYRIFGEKGYRVFQGVSGAVIILCGAVIQVLW